MKNRIPCGPFFILIATVGILLPPALQAAASFSLADDFSYTDNTEGSAWSYRLEDATNGVFPLLTRTDRSANDLWGSDFPNPPMMWSEAAGYWGIGKNLSGHELFSSRNGTRWAPGEILFHPKAGSAPARLVVCWTAPSNMVVDIHYSFGRGSPQGNGIGYGLFQRVKGKQTLLAGLQNIGGGLSNQLRGITVSKADQLLFRFDTDGDAGGDLSGAEIKIQETARSATAMERRIQPAAAAITAGSDLVFTLPASGARKFQWLKDGRPIEDATKSSLLITQASMAEAGVYSLIVDSMPGGEARLTVSSNRPSPEPYPSPTPRQIFSGILGEQEEELRTNELMLRFAASRKRLSADPYRPAYHFVSPESQLNDPNGLCFWQGRWHLFYQAYPPDEFPDPSDIPKRRQHWGHAVSEDLVHWRDLPYAIYPGVERMCFSGSTVVDADQIMAFYPGIGAGQMVAVAKDPLLLNWEKLGGRPVRSPSGDSCIWKEGDVYFGLVGADNLVSSTNLENWTVHPGFLEGNPFPLGDAAACPGFVPIGNKYLLVSFSHTTGGQYRLGDYDQKLHRFKPYAMGRFNHGAVSPGGVHAPSAAADGKGGVINILNINDAKPSPDWDQIMSLAQQLTLGPDSQLRIEPVAAVASLRNEHQHIGETLLPANKEITLEAIHGQAMELDAEIDPQLARWVQLNVLRSPEAEEQTSITIYNFDRKLSIWYDTKTVVCLDASRSSLSPDVWIRPPEREILEYASRDWASAPIATTPGKPVRLRVFVDHSVVEVFVNERLYLALRVYPARPDSVGVSLRAQGQDALLKKLDAWQMQSIWN